MNARKKDHTVCFLREPTLFGEREEDLLHGSLEDGRSVPFKLAEM